MRLPASQPNLVRTRPGGLHESCALFRCFLAESFLTRASCLRADQPWPLLWQDTSLDLAMASRFASFAAWINILRKCLGFCSLCIHAPQLSPNRLPPPCMVHGTSGSPTSRLRLLAESGMLCELVLRASTMRVTCFLGTCRGETMLCRYRDLRRGSGSVGNRCPPPCVF